MSTTKKPYPLIFTNTESRFSPKTILVTSPYKVTSKTRIVKPNHISDKKCAIHYDKRRITPFHANN